MTRLNLVLLAAVMASALYLVRTQYESRRLFTEIDKAHAESRRLELDNERLQVEKRAQATPARVEKVAREQLKMRSATPAITQYVTYKPQPGDAPLALPPARASRADTAASAPVAAGSTAARTEARP